jgi:hypothetical protein
MQLAAIEHALGDPHAALAAIRRATEPLVRPLADEELGLALEHRFALELQLGLAMDALETIERRAALGRIPSRDPLARQRAALRRALGAPDTNLAVQGRIDTEGRWEHALSRGTLAVGDVEGESEPLELEVECHRQKRQLPFDEEMEVTVPDSWGACALVVRGRPGTTFMLYEFEEPIAP